MAEKLRLKEVHRGALVAYAGLPWSRTPGQIPLVGEVRRLSDAISKAAEAIEILRGSFFGFDALQLIDSMIRQNIGQHELPESYEGDHYTCAEEVFEMSWSDYTSELGTGDLSEEYRKHVTTLLQTLCDPDTFPWLEEQLTQLFVTPDWVGRVCEYIGERMESWGGKLISRFDCADQHLTIAPDLQELVGGRYDGAEVFAPIQIELPIDDDGVFDSIQSIGWSTQEDELNIAAKIDGHEVWITIRATPFEDSKPTLHRIS